MSQPSTHVTRWPPLVPVVCGVIVGINLAASVLQERANGYTLTGGIIAAAVAWLPWGSDIFGSVRGQEAHEPTWWLAFFPIPVLIGVGWLIWHPADTDFAPFVLVFMNGELVSRATGRRWIAMVVGLASVTMMVAAQTIGPWTSGAFIWVIGIAFGWFGGYLISQLDARTMELEAAQGELAAKAAAEERSRIAREVHDVIAHSLSVTMLHVTAARMALERGDRADEATDWLREAEEQGRKSLTEIRRTVGLLGPEESAHAPPMPTAVDLPDLVQDFRGAGLEVTLKMEGEVDALPPAAALNLYRIVQESLTNAAKHSPGAKTDVWLNVTDDDIRLRVFNEGANGQTSKPTTDGGRGLRGMAERAVMLNGHLAVGAETGGWMVFLSAPRPTA
ncbi:MAG: histidine kinase [Actinomycetota bacterium]